MLPSEVPRLTTTCRWERFLVFGNLSFLRLPSWDGSPSLPLLSLYLLYFFLPPFEDIGPPFWVPNVLCQHSEVVLWNLLGVHMFFWWIFGGESGLPVLFLCYLRTAASHKLSNHLTGFIFFVYPFYYKKRTCSFQLEHKHQNTTWHTVDTW